MDTGKRTAAKHPVASLAGTRAVDAEGRPLLLYHATNRPFDRFSVTSDLGFHFGSRLQAEKRMANMISRGEAGKNDPWRIVTCALAIRSPLVIADDPGVWNPRWLTATLCSFLDSDDRDRIRGHAAELDARTPGSDVTPRDRAALSGWLSVLAGGLKRAGHDGIVYRNVFESAGRAIEWSWLAFDDSQVVRLDVDSGHALPDRSVGEPLRLRGAGPMRQHQAYGIGNFMRSKDRADFRHAVESWADSAGIEWDETYPLDYQPSFGECRPSHDLSVKVGEGEGYRVRVSSSHGTVLLQPFSADETCDKLMKRFSSDASEGFFEHGLKQSASQETVSWRPAETLATFRMRLDAVHRDFAATFPASATGPAGPGCR